jgi:hypothetical protein
MGGDMDGMGDLDNAPMPPMGPDSMGGDPMADPMGGATDNMGNEPPMDAPMGGEDPNAMGGEDDELMNIINGLSIEDKAAVTKYAKSMADNSEGAEDPVIGGEALDMGGEMPMESRKGMRNIIDEVINDVIDNKEGTKRPEKKMPKQYRNMEMPFKSPF